MLVPELTTYTSAVPRIDEAFTTRMLMFPELGAVWLSVSTVVPLLVTRAVSYVSAPRLAV